MREVKPVERERAELKKERMEFSLSSGFSILNWAEDGEVAETQKKLARDVDE